jgi:hypothetical protein
MKPGFLAALVSAALVAGGCVDGGIGLNVHDSVDVTRPLAANGRFSLENTNGSVRVATWDEPRVRIEAVKSASTERALRELEVSVEGEGDSVSVRSRMPRGRWFGRGGKVDYTVTLPRGASVSVRNVNGRIEIQGVAGRVQAANVNGSLDANDLGGAVEASTVNGSVEVRMARIDATSHNRISTTNGSVRVTLPRDAAIDLAPPGPGPHRRRRRPFRAPDGQRQRARRSRAHGRGPRPLASGSRGHSRTRSIGSSVGPRSASNTRAHEPVFGGRTPGVGE